ncbi:MAG: SDR family NAD(P)-dependent oxidoreductase [Steroidobacteraceae bacterium]|nr:SDR family NAD(P)-dependent oxidoreductase [Nevskiaceae bacterium]
MQIKDNVALITGGSSGIGFGTARRMLDEGASVMVCPTATVRWTRVNPSKSW